MNEVTNLAEQETKPQQQSSPTTSPSGYRYVMVAVAFMIQISSALSIKCVSPLGALMREDIGMSYTEFGYIFSLINLGTVLLLTWVGNRADITSPRKIAVTGLVVSGIALCVAAMTTASWQMLVCMFIVGMGNSVAGTCSAKAIATWFGKKGRAGAMGIKQAAIPFGGMVTAAVLPSLALAVGWRNAMIMDGAVIIVLGILSFVLFRDAPGVAEARAAAAANRQKGSTIAKWKTLFSRDMVLLALAGCIMLGAQYVYTSYVALYLTDVFDASGIENGVVYAGFALTISNLGGMLGSIVWGQISDRVFLGRRKPLLIGLNVFAIVSLLVMAFFAPTAGLIPAMVISFFVGLCWSSWSGLWITFSADIVGAKLAGLASGFMLTMSFIGMTVMPLIGGFVFDSTSFLTGWIFLAVVNAIGIVVISLVHDNKAATA